MPTPCENCGNPNCKGLIQDSEYEGYDEARMQCITNAALRNEHRKNSLLEVLFDQIEIGNLERVQELLIQGAPIAIQDANGKFATTALHKAASHNRIPIARFLIKHAGASVDCPDRMGLTPLHLAASEGLKDMTAYLVEEEHADIWATSGVGQTPLKIAQENSHSDVAHYLAGQIAENPVKGEWVEANVQGIDLEGLALVGRRVSVFYKPSGRGFMGKKEWVNGTVIEYDEYNLKHRVRYDNGEMKWEHINFNKPNKFKALERVQDSAAELEVAQVVNVSDLENLTLSESKQEAKLKTDL